MIRCGFPTLVDTDSYPYGTLVVPPTTDSPTSSALIFDTRTCRSTNSNHRKNASLDTAVLADDAVLSPHLLSAPPLISMGVPRSTRLHSGCSIPRMASCTLDASSFRRFPAPFVSRVHLDSPPTISTSLWNLTPGVNQRSFLQSRVVARTLPPDLY